jgi:hypothetical protein
MGKGHIKRTVANEDHGKNMHASSSARCYYDRAVCQRPNVATKSSLFRTTSLFNMKTDNAKISYYPKEIGIDHGREEFVNYVQFDGSSQNLILYGHSLQFFAEPSI